MKHRPPVERDRMWSIAWVHFVDQLRSGEDSIAAVVIESRQVQAVTESFKLSACLLPQKDVPVSFPVE